MAGRNKNKQVVMFAYGLAGLRSNLGRVGSVYILLLHVVNTNFAFHFGNPGSIFGWDGEFSVLKVTVLGSGLGKQVYTKCETKK